MPTPSPAIKGRAARTPAPCKVFLWKCGKLRLPREIFNQLYKKYVKPRENKT
jgi:hypothetical protein